MFKNLLTNLSFRNARNKSPCLAFIMNVAAKTSCILIGLYFKTQEKETCLEYRCRHLFPRQIHEGLASESRTMLSLNTLHNLSSLDYISKLVVHLTELYFTTISKKDIKIQTGVRFFFYFVIVFNNNEVR